MEEMEKLLKEAQQEKARLIENRVGLCCCLTREATASPQGTAVAFHFVLFNTKMATF